MKLRRLLPSFPNPMLTVPSTMLGKEVKKGDTIHLIVARSGFTREVMINASDTDVNYRKSDIDAKEDRDKKTFVVKFTVDDFWGVPRGKRSVSSSQSKS